MCIRDSFNISCNSQLIVSLLPVLTVSLCCVFLRKLKWKDPSNRLLITAFLFVVAANILTFIHYFFIIDHGSNTFIMLMNIITTAS